MENTDQENAQEPDYKKLYTDLLSKIKGMEEDGHKTLDNGWNDQKSYMNLVWSLTFLYNDEIKKLDAKL